MYTDPDEAVNFRSHRRFEEFRDAPAQGCDAGGPACGARPSMPVTAVLGLLSRLPDAGYETAIRWRLLVIASSICA